MLNYITNLGKWLFILPFTVFGFMHIAKAENMTALIPTFMPGGAMWVYLTGFAQLAFAASVVLGKFDKLAALLCALMLFIFILTLHLPGLSNLQMSQLAMNNMLKDIGLIGGALMYAHSFARDKSVVG
jgi:putative oxidoreductase